MSEVEDYALEAAAKALVQIRMSGMDVEAKTEMAKKVFLKYGLSPRAGSHIVGGFKTYEDHVKFVDRLKQKRVRENRLIKNIIDREVERQFPAFMERLMDYMMKSWKAYLNRRISRVLNSDYHKRFNNGDEK